MFARASDKLDAEAMVIQAGMFHQQYRKETSQKMVADLLRENDDEVHLTQYTARPIIDFFPAHRLGRC